MFQNTDKIERDCVDFRPGQVQHLCHLTKFCTGITEQNMFQDSYYGGLVKGRHGCLGINDSIKLSQCKLMGEAVRTTQEEIDQGEKEHTAFLMKHSVNIHHSVTGGQL